MTATRPITRRWRQTLIAILVLLSPAMAWADSYRVDLIVFLNTHAVRETPTLPQAMAEAAIDPSDVAALAAAGVRVLPASDFALTSQWQHLANASQFRPLLRLSWIQDNPPSNGGPALHIRSGNPYTVVAEDGFSSAAVSPVDGQVRLQASRYLHLDADLQYTDNGSSGLSSYRLREKRRMRRDELHHLDSPKLGILARVIRVEETSP